MPESYGMSDANLIKLVIEPGWWHGDSPLLNHKTSYWEVIGSLMYMAQWMQSDISFAVNATSKAQDALTQAHQQLARFIRQYLKGTKNDFIHFETYEMDNINVHSDANHVGNNVTHRLTRDSVIMFVGGAVLSKSKLQRCIALL